MKKEEIEQQMLPEKSLLQGGKYRVDRRIASGGFGNTYEVTNVEFEERMALKEFFIKGVSQRDTDNTTVSVSNTLNKGQFEAQKEKFKKEARRLRKMHNAHIVQVHDLFEENGTAYYAMDFVDGESLSSRLKRTGKPLTEQEVMAILSQVLDALEDVHGQGIWHLDLKPGNIMVDRQGNAKLIDFGASKQMSATGMETTTTSMCYTKGYAPTEQVDQKMELVGPWTDLYALGATLYNLLSTKTPPTISEMQEKDAFVYPSTVSAKMRHLIQWMMMPQRHKRPQSVAEVRTFLAKPFVETLPPDDEEETQLGKAPASKASIPEPMKEESVIEPSPSKGKKWIKMGVAALVLLGILLVWNPFGEKEPEKPLDDTKIVKAVQQTETPKVKQVTERYFNSALGVCSYTGPVDEKDLPHGAGKATFTDGRLYRGPFVHGKMEGNNAYFRYDNGDTFEGSFRNERFYEGRYTMKSDGSYFVGKFSNGQPSTGQWYDKNGKKI